MPLNWNAEKVPQDIRTKYAQHLEAAIWNSMAIGVPDLTEKTIDEATRRTRMLEEAKGAYLYDADEGTRPLWLWERLPMFIGLSTNGGHKTKARFLQDIK